MNFKAESNPLLPIFCIQSIPYSSLYLRSESTFKARNRIKQGSQVHFYVNLTYSRFAWSSTFLCKTGNHPLSQKKKTIWNCNEMGMSKWWQMVHFGVKYSFKPWYVNKAFSEISHPYQHTREYRTNQNYTTERTLSQCVTTHRIKYTTSSMVKWHLLSCWGYKVIPKTLTIPHYGMQWLFQEAHTITVTRKRRIIGRKLHTQTNTHIGLVENFWKVSKWN